MKAFLKQLSPKVILTLWFLIALLISGLFLESRAGKAGVYFANNIFEAIEQTLLDKRLVMRSKALSPSQDIVVVALDHKMMVDAKNYPELDITGLTLNRQNLGKVVAYIAQQNPQAIILDIELMSTQDDDEELAGIFKEAGNVYSAFRMDNPLETFLINKKVPAKHLAEVLKASGMPNEEAFQTQFCMNGFYTQSYKNAPEFLIKLKSTALPLSETPAFAPSLLKSITFCNSGQTSSKLLDSLKAFGVSSVRYDSDALVRKVTPVYRGYQEAFYGNLSFKPVVDFLGVDNLNYSDNEIKLLKNNTVLKKMTLDGTGKVFVNWRDPSNSVPWIKKFGGSEALVQELKSQFNHRKANAYLGGGVLYRTVSVSDILRQANHINIEKDPPYTLFNLPYPNAGKKGMYSFKDKFVVIGNSVTDVHQTPMAEVTPGPEIIATALDMYLNDNQFIQAMPIEWNFIIAGIITILMALLIIRLKSVFYAVLYCFALFFTFTWANFNVFYHEGLWIPIAAPSGVFAFSIVLSIFYRYQIHDKEKRYLTTVFSKYLSPQVLDQVIENPETALEKLRGQKRYMTVLFSDLYGFTSYMDEADPETIMNQLTLYFDAMIDVVYQHGGTYDKFMGDGLLVFFGAPVEMSDHALKACQAALAMQQRLTELNQQFEKMGLKKLEQGIGISTGEMIVGNFGSSEIKNFTVMGSAVNLGARLEAYTRQVEGNILISEESYNNLQDEFSTTRHENLTIKGLSETITAYTIHHKK